MEAKKRIKADDEIIGIPNWEAADKMVRKIAKLEAEISRREQQAKREIDAVKKSLADDVAEPQKLIKQARRSLEHFSINHKKDFAGQRSKKLNFGIVGWRRSTVVRVAKDTLGLIKRKFPRRGFIRITEAVDKDQLGKLNEKQLATVNAKLSIKNKFFVDLLLPQAAKY